MEAVRLNKALFKLTLYCTLHTVHYTRCKLQTKSKLHTTIINFYSNQYILHKKFTHKTKSGTRTKFHLTVFIPADVNADIHSASSDNEKFI